MGVRFQYVQNAEQSHILFLINCQALVPCPYHNLVDYFIPACKDAYSVQGFGFLWKFWFRPFFPLSNLKICSPLLYSIFRDTFCVLNLKNYCGSCKYQCKNNFYFHLSIVCTIYLQRGWVFCCSRQTF